MTKVYDCAQVLKNDRKNVRHAEEGASSMRLSRSTHALHGTFDEVYR
jgi:hypothetical protein